MDLYTGNRGLTAQHFITHKTRVGRLCLYVCVSVRHTFQWLTAGRHVMSFCCLYCFGVKPPTKFGERLVWKEKLKRFKGKTLTFCSLHCMTTAVLKWRQFREYRYFFTVFGFHKMWPKIDRKYNSKRSKFQWSLRTRKTIIYASLHVKLVSGTEHLSREVLCVQPKDFPIKQSCKQSLQVTF